MKRTVIIRKLSEEDAENVELCKRHFGEKTSTKPVLRVIAEFVFKQLIEEGRLPSYPCTKPRGHEGPHESDPERCMQLVWRDES